MGLVDKLLGVMHLNDDDDDNEEITYANDDYDLDEKDDAEERKAVRKEKSQNARVKEEKAEAPKEKAAAKPANKPAFKSVPNISAFSKSRKQVEEMEVCVIKPSSMEDAREITETLLNGRCVLVNMEGLQLDIAQRIIDFISGACFAISGNLQKISNYIFVLTPSNVDISGDYQEMLDSLV